MMEQWEKALWRRAQGKPTEITPEVALDALLALERLRSELRRLESREAAWVESERAEEVFREVFRTMHRIPEDSQ